MSSSRPGDEGRTPIRSSAASNTHTLKTRPEPVKSKRFRTPFNMVSRKRFVALLSGALAAIMIPVFVTSAGGAGVYRSTNGSVSYPVPNHVDTLKASSEAVAVTAYTKATVVDAPESQDSAGDADESSGSGAPATTGGSNEPAGQDASDAQAAAAPQPEGEESVEPEEEPEVILQPGDRNDAVIALQQRLMELDYMENDEPTDYYGPQTQQAVGYFQRKNGLDVDGCAGPKTQALLFSNDAKVYTVAEGAAGNDVAEIQERLVNLGYPCAVTGYFGTTTSSAVSYFQRMTGLTDDGSVGTATRDALFSENAIRAIPPKPSPEPPAQTAPDANGGGAQESSSEGSSAQTAPESSGGGNGGGSSQQAEPPASNGGGSSQQAEPPAADNNAPAAQAEPPASNGGGGDAPAANSGSVEGFVAAACAQEGKPYVLGGKGPNSFDCSGLVYYALNASGKKIGYMTSGGWAASGYPSISWDNLQRGDVLCFRGHVGVYLGGGTMCDASSSNGRIMIRGMGSWARNNFICGKRPL